MLDIIDAFGSGVLTVLQILFLIKCAVGIKNKFTIKKAFLIVLSFSVVFAFVYLYFDGFLKTFLGAIVFVCLSIVYNVSFLKSLFLTFVYIFTLMIPDLLLLFFVVVTGFVVGCVVGTVTGFVVG